MRKAWFVLGGFALGVVTTAILTPRRAPPRGNFAPHVSLAERELDRVVGRIDLGGVPFDQAVQDVRKLTAVPIVVDDQELASSRFNRSTPVTMHGSDVSLDLILTRLAQGNGFGPELGYCVQDGRIVITSAAKLAEMRTVRCYDVQDVLRSPLLDDSTSDTSDHDSPLGFYWGPMPRAMSLMSLIKDTVATESWSDNGGSVGGMYYLSKHLFVCQSWQNHHAIARLLAEISASEPSVSPAVNQVWSELRKEWIPTASIHAAEALISKPIERLDLDHQTFDEAIDTLQRLSGVTIWIDRAELPVHLISAVTPISLHLKGGSLTNALNALSLLQAGQVQLGYMVQDGIVLITSRGKASHNPIVRTYDVRDLVTPPDARGTKNGDDRLLTVIESQIDEESWADNGGPTGKLSLWHGRLIVSQTWPNQEAISELLQTLRSGGTSPRAVGPSTDWKGR